MSPKKYYFYPLKKKTKTIADFPFCVTNEDKSPIMHPEPCKISYKIHNALRSNQIVDLYETVTLPDISGGYTPAEIGLSLRLQ